MRDFSTTIVSNNIPYRLYIEPVYNEILKETDYIIRCYGHAFMLAWDNGDNPQFRVQGKAPYFAREIEEDISKYIEERDM